MFSVRYLVFRFLNIPSDAQRANFEISRAKKKNFPQTIKSQLKNVSRTSRKYKLTLYIKERIE